MKIYLNSYRPLVHNRAGRTAVQKYGIPPFVDASCRREPDFEAEFPSITALCRFRHFAPRLHEKDVAVYLTVKRQYSGCSEQHWRLTALLQVIKRFENHERAAEWYRSAGLPLPSNCMVEGNAPVALDRTDRFHPSLDSWDRLYRNKARRCSVFLACRSLFRELNNPPVVTEAIMVRSFGYTPATRTPPTVPVEPVQRLIAEAGVDLTLPV
jgi:hypothetical protein